MAEKNRALSVSKKFKSIVKNILSDFTTEEQSFLSDFSKIHRKNQAGIYFHPSHSQPIIIYTRFCALVG